MKNKAGMIFAAVAYAILAVIFVLTVFPIIYTFFASFKTNQEILAVSARLLPEKFEYSNYSKAWVLADFKRATFNSVYMTFFVVLGVIITSTMSGYVFARGNFRGSKLIFSVFAGTMFVSLGSLTLRPLLEVAKLINIHKSLWGVIIIQIFGLNMANIYLVRTFIKSIPYEIDEAATIDGCSFFRIFWNVIFPLLKPIIATVGLITFRDAWNNYLLPMVFTIANPAQAPLVVCIVALKSTGEAASSWNLMLAGTMISVVPMLAAYLILNKYFISGLITGAVKG